jgi:hypothetical protein
VNRTSKACGPFITFIVGTLISIFAYGKKHIRIRVDDGNEQTVEVLNIAVANGRYHGGGMLVAPDASTDDGLFDVTVIGAMSLPMVFWHLPKLYIGESNVSARYRLPDKVAPLEAGPPGYRRRTAKAPLGRVYRPRAIKWSCRILLLPPGAPRHHVPLPFPPIVVIPMRDISPLPRPCRHSLPPGGCTVLLLTVT